MPVYERAYAKINLLLDVTGKRADGYHDLQTIYQSLALYDTLTFNEVPDDRVSLSCNDPSLPVGSDNLIVRAAERLRLMYSVSQGVHISLVKRIPVAAGLAGGSSDAAATLRGLVRMWKLPWEQERLLAAAADLGSDVPFCLFGGTALGTGRGEKITRLSPCPPFQVVLANPGFPVQTASVYHALKTTDLNKAGNVDSMVRAFEAHDHQEVICHLLNTLEQSTFRLYPSVKELKDRMNRDGSALMCGSGPSVFALFTSAHKAHLQADMLRQEGIHVWLTETMQEITVGSEQNV